MAKRSSVEQIPKAVKEWLDRALVESNFSGYTLLHELAKAKGVDISRSALGRYGQKFEERIKTLRLATEQAKAIVDASPDDGNAMSEALTRMVQEKLFTVLMALEVNPEDINITKVSRAIADLTRASISQKKWAIEAKTRLDERLKVMEADAKKQTGDQKAIALDMLKKIREEAYGIFQ